MFVHSFDIKVHFTLFKKPLKRPLGLKRGTPLTACSVVESQLGLERLRVSSRSLFVNSMVTVELDGSLL